MCSCFIDFIKLKQKYFLLEEESVVHVTILIWPVDTATGLVALVAEQGKLSNFAFLNILFERNILLVLSVFVKSDLRMLCFTFILFFVCGDASRPKK